MARGCCPFGGSSMGGLFGGCEEGFNEVSFGCSAEDVGCVLDVEVGTTAAHISDLCVCCV